MLKLLVVVLFIVTVVSLSSAAFFLIKDTGTDKRCIKSLTFRVISASLLLSIVAWGLSSGRLVSKAPWEQHIVRPANIQK
ncbi:DUF2909 domain-containing protein [Agaribacterium haliotis]|uniref:DUF2909 domain-containing protein n=1 Tax=Agaribacterium haliotis TaxID=2013869 RepID=UPI000BB53853|nr:DUF2909 domain-containing protein [Agaribacterium haliotis]